MKVLTGHLTATDKRNIKYILACGLTEGKIKHKTYYLTSKGDVYTVKQHQQDRGIIPCPGSELRTSVYTSTFKL
jgi:hypothetical protein